MLTSIATMAAISFGSPAASDPGLVERSRYRLELPSVALDVRRREYVTRVSVVARCAALDGTASVPYDWIVEPAQAPIPRTALVLTAPRGDRQFQNMRELSGFVGVQPYDLACFDVSAVVSTSLDGMPDREHVFGRAHLKLKQ